MPLESIFVNTRSSIYELIVLQGDRGDVLVRGGRILGAFRRARLVGSTVGGSALKPNIIDVGFRMELSLDGQIMVTSAVETIVRDSCPEVSH
jgi:hypothetical protein